MWEQVGYRRGESGSYRVLPVCLLYPHPSVPPPSPCAHTSSSLFEAIPVSQCQASPSPQLPTPFL